MLPDLSRSEPKWDPSRTVGTLETPAHTHTHTSYLSTKNEHQEGRNWNILNDACWEIEVLTTVGIKLVAVAGSQWLQIPCPQSIHFPPLVTQKSKNVTAPYICRT